MGARDTEPRLLVFDIGGSHAAAGLVRGARVEGRSSCLLDSDGPADAIFNCLEQLGNKVQLDCGLEAGALTGLSLGMPNPFDYERGISYMRHKYGNLYGKNLREELAARFGLPTQAVTFINDASAYLLGELHHGAAVGANRVIGITLGTGVGSAFAIAGEIVTCGAGVPDGGFIWDAPYNGGIVEDFVSTRGLRKTFQELSGRDMEIREIARIAPNDSIAMNAMNQFGEVLGDVLRSICADFRPDVIVLGGAISRSADLFLPPAQKQLNCAGSRLVVSRLFDDAALLGAAVAWREAAGISANVRL